MRKQKEAKRKGIATRSAGSGRTETGDVREGACGWRVREGDPAELAEAEKMLREFVAMEKEGG